MSFQLPLPAFDANIVAVNEERKGPSGCNRQSLPLKTDAMARSQSEQLSLWAIAQEKARCAMKAREIKGLEIATNSQIARDGNVWIVPSQTSSKRYTVDLSIPTCTCPDFEENRGKCKHIYAVEYTLQREGGVQLPAPQKVSKPTYRQAWREYNQATRREKTYFQHLLSELCRNIPKPDQQKGRGRPSLPLADIIFSGAFKVYTTFSGRRFRSDLNQAYRRGYLFTEPHPNSISRYLEGASIAPYLHHLIERSALPLLELESVAAVDSTGFSTSRFARWLDAKHKKDEEHREWLKLHALVGVRTNVVVCAEVTELHP